MKTIQYIFSAFFFLFVSITTINAQSVPPPNIIWSFDTVGVNTLDNPSTDYFYWANDISSQTYDGSTDFLIVTDTGALNTNFSDDFVYAKNLTGNQGQPMGDAYVFVFDFVNFLGCTNAAYINFDFAYVAPGDTAIIILEYTNPYYSNDTVSFYQNPSNAIVAGNFGMYPEFDLTRMTIRGTLTGDNHILQLDNFHAVGSFGLPVAYTFFHAEYADNIVQVSWSTENEDKNSHFDVQRSSDGRTFSTIGTVDASVGQGESGDYRFMDNNPLPNISYYRLSQVDKDGTTTHSNMISVITSGRPEITPASFVLYGDIHISHSFAPDKTVGFSVYTLDGRMVAKGLARDGDVIARDLSSGGYLVSLRYDNEVKVDRLFVR